MLKKFQLTLRPDAPCAPRAHWAYLLYASLLEQVPPAYGAALHHDGTTPMTQYLTPQPDGTLLWTVTLLGKTAREEVSPILETQTRYPLRKYQRSLEVVQQSCQSIETLDQLLAMAQTDQNHRLCFVTPAAFRQQNYYRLLPEPRLILQSQLKKWNGCFPECPIEDMGGGLEAMAAGLVLEDLHLNRSFYRLKGTSIPGFVGSIVLSNHLDGFHQLLANALLEFSGFAGVGIKTALGMGGTIHELCPRNPREATGRGSDRGPAL